MFEKEIKALRRIEKKLRQTKVKGSQEIVNNAYESVRDAKLTLMRLDGKL